MKVFAMFDGLMDSFKGVISDLLLPLNRLLEVFSDFKLGAVIIIVAFLSVFLISVFVTKETGFGKLKNPRCLSICAMLIALNVILGYFSIQFSAYLRIGFSFTTVPVAAYLFGPVAGGVVGMISDVISLILKPTGGWLFTYTLNMGISGMICGIFLYGKKLTVKRVFLYKAVEIIAVNILLNSIAIAPTVANGLAGIFPARLIKNIILLPIQGFVVYEILKRVIEGRVKC